MFKITLRNSCTIAATNEIQICVVHLITIQVYFQVTRVVSDITSVETSSNTGMHLPINRLLVTVIYVKQTDT